MKRMSYETGCISLIGDRPLNQDRSTLVESKESIFLALADGMGGHPRGEAAAQILIDICENAFSKVRKPISDPDKFLAHILHKAHTDIIAFGTKQSPPGKPCTTAVLALIQENRVYFAHCGDSRFYLFRDGQALTRTLDHSYVELLHQQGSLSAAACENHPYRNYVTRCLGGRENSIEVAAGIPIPLQANDTLLLCSDGLWGTLGDDLLTTALSTPAPVDKALAKLAHTATSAAHPESDNVTAVAVRWIEGASSGLTKEPPPRKSSTLPPSEGNDDELTQAINDLQELIDIYDTNPNQEKK